jgi:hypothetical protein
MWLKQINCEGNLMCLADRDQPSVAVAPKPIPVAVTASGSLLLLNPKQCQQVLF